MLRIGSLTQKKAEDPEQMTAEKDEMINELEKGHVERATNGRGGERVSDELKERVTENRRGK